MKLSEVIFCMESVAMQQPSINMIVQSDVFRINSAPSLKYGVFAWTQGQHTGRLDGLQTFNFTLFYVDRLTEDKSNTIEIQSIGCEVLGNILRCLEDFDIEVDSYSLQPFNQRFTDECAGVFCNVSLSVAPTTVCSEDFADNTRDFNTDFLIY